MPFNQTSNDLKHSLEYKLANFSFNQVSELPIYIRADKWVLASALQKAIRRSNIDGALSAAYILSKVDNEKFWIRLAVIQLEDLAPEKLEDRYAVLWSADHPAWRRLSDNEGKLLQLFVEQSCASPKNRIANDLLAISNRHPSYKLIADELSRLKDQELADIYLDPNYPLPERAISAWYLCGVQMRRLHNMKVRKGNWRFFLDLHAGGEYPDNLLKSMRRGFSGGEGHARTYALSWRTREEHKDHIHFQNEVTSESPTIGNLTSETFDIHTGIGKIAYKSLVTRENQISAFLRKHLPDADHVRALGMSIFALEGMLVDRREMFSGVLDLTEMAKAAYVSIYGLTGAIKEDFFALLSDNFDLIHDARAKACRSTGLIP